MLAIGQCAQCVRVYIVSAIPHALPASPAYAPARSPVLGPAGWPGAPGLRGPGGYSRSESGWATKGENPTGFQYNSQYNCAGNWGPKISQRCLRR